MLPTKENKSKLRRNQTPTTISPVVLVVAVALVGALAGARSFPLRR